MLVFNYNIYFLSLIFVFIGDTTSHPDVSFRIKRASQGLSRHGDNDEVPSLSPSITTYGEKLPTKSFKKVKRTTQTSDNEDCGVIPSKSLTLNDDEEIVKTHPWNAEIYVKDEKDGSINFFCAGTLVSPYAVVSAAHCFELLRNEQYKNFTIGLGKVNKDIIPGKDEKNAQLIEVKNIFIPPTYAGDERGYYMSDIALLELKNKVIISQYVRPACIDESNSLILTNNSVGSVAGWGNPIYGFTKKLKTGSVEYFSNEKCHEFMKQLKLDDEIVTMDTFCTFYPDSTNSTSAEIHMSGTGLTFPFHDRHYLVGISLSYAKIDEKSVFVFNNLKYKTNLDFVNNNLKNINMKHNSH